ncbi:MAG: LysR family transcriptional regulator, partial [Bacteroidales bacterium]|nr:LysR family transcriptional regulator [Bacteroidales bacterium]
MELRQLRYFVKAAGTLNFSEAAKSLYVTQSTLSQQIRQLENELGVQLFERNSHEVSLTDAGEELLPYAMKTLESAET